MMQSTGLPITRSLSTIMRTAGPTDRLKHGLQTDAVAVAMLSGMHQPSKKLQRLNLKLKFRVHGDSPTEHTSQFRCRCAARCQHICRGNTWGRKILTSITRRISRTFQFSGFQFTIHLAYTRICHHNQCSPFCTIQTRLYPYTQQRFFL